MKAINFDEVNVQIAENQPEYNTLPAHGDAAEGSFTYCFELSKEDLQRVIKSRRIYFKQLVGDQDLQPIHPSTQKSQLIPGAKDD